MGEEQAPQERMGGVGMALIIRAPGAPAMSPTLG